MNNYERPKVFFRIPQWIGNSIILLGTSCLIVYATFPHIQNAFLKLKTVNLYRVGYRATFNGLNTIVPLIGPNEEENEADISPLNSRYALEEINFAETVDEQKNYHSNEYTEETNVESLSTRLRINSANITGPVVDGHNDEALSRGFWYLPVSAKIGKKGNVVIIGHRFLKIPPATDTFFNLDKVQIGDQVEIEQGADFISYTVVEKKVVSPDERNVIYPTNDYRLTLITCTPLWQDTKRLVVVAIQNQAGQGI